MTRTRTLKFLFSDKHRDYIRKTKECEINIAEGAVRAGKTIDNIFAFAAELEITPDKIHLATGSTSANAKMNIGDSNGLGLEWQFRGRCRWGKYKGNECLRIKTRTGTKYVIFAGGAKEDSYKKIRGNSYGMWIATEINLHHDKTIKEASNRQLAAKNRKIYWDLNPDNPNAPIYINYIDKYAKMTEEEQKLMGGVNYQLFNIKDNLTITPERLQAIEMQYDTNSIWYKRDILGQRAIAEGLVYQQFADNSQKWIKQFGNENEKEAFTDDIQFISVGIDFGGNRSLTTFVATAIHKNFNKITAIDDYHIQGKKGEIDSDRLNKEFISFILQLQKKYPNVYIKYGFADNEAQYLINGLRKACRNANLSIQILDCAKKEVKQRIYCTNTLFNVNRLEIMNDCNLLIQGLQMATWDEKMAAQGKDVRLDNFSTDIDILDAFEYSFEQFMKKLLPN